MAAPVSSPAPVTDPRATIDHIRAASDTLRSEHVRSDELGMLSDATAAILKDSQGMRLLQARSHGGLQADPRIFFEWVRTVARANPSAGWVAGVVGVHPWEVALHDPRVQDEIYGDDPDVWAASPYAPHGVATPVEGGFRFSGRWQYSTGTDHCDWVILGGRVDTGAATGPPDIRHFVLPRSDYEIIDDSWHVMGLQGTGSKDIVIDDAFVPDYRTLGHMALCDGEFGHRRADETLYQLPFGCVFSAAIASATLGIAQGAVDVYRDYLRSRVSVMGVAGTTDPFQQQALAEAESDIAAGVAHIDSMFAGWLERVETGERLTRDDRLEFRRNQVRAVQRVLVSIDTMMARAGSSAAWTTHPLERYWRDLRTAGTHISNVIDTIYASWANHNFDTGEPVRTFH